MKLPSPFRHRLRPLHWHILVLALPSFLALIAEPLLSIVDTAFVSRLGVKELGILAIITSFLTSLTWLFNFLVSGTTASVAFYYGENKPEKATHFYVLSQSMALCGGVLLMILGYLLEPYVFELMGADESMQLLGHQYYVLRLAGLPLVLSYFVAMGYFRGVQNMKTPMYIAISVNILNILLDWLLIFGVPGIIPALQLQGAALATLLSQLIGFLLFHLLLFRSQRELYQIHHLFNPNMALLSSMFTVNRNLFLRTLFLLSSLTVATAVAARMNATSLAVHQIAMQLWLFCSFALDSFAIAGQSIAGRLKGQKSAKALHTYGFLLQYWGLATGFLFAAVLYLGKPLLLSLFTTDEQVLLLLTGLYPFIIFLQPMNGITFILDGFLTGVLDTGWLMIQLIVAGGIVFIPISLLSLKLDWGITGLWWGLSAFLITRFAFNEFRFITQGYPNGRR